MHRGLGLVELAVEGPSQQLALVLEFHGLEGCRVVRKGDDAHASEFTGISILEPPDVYDIADVLEVVAHRIIIDGPC